MKFCSFALSFCLIAFISNNLFAQSWSQFRGDAANPVAEKTSIPDRWSTTENVEWATEVAGRGWSSPIVVGDRIFITAAVTDGESKSPQAGVAYSNEYVAELSRKGLSKEEIEKAVMERDFELPDAVNLHCFLYCLDLNSGKELWKREFHSGKPPGGRHRKNSFASETPVSDGEHVFVYSTHVGLFAYTLDGEPVWNTNLDSHKIYMEFGTGASPVLLGQNLIILDDNEESSSLTAYDKSDGKLVWRTERTPPEGANPALPKSGWMTPYIWKTDKRTEIVTVGPGVAISYDEAGKELWRMKGMTLAPSASSFAFEDVLLLNGGKARPIFAVLPGAEGDITLEGGTLRSDNVAWSRPRSGTYIPTPVAYDGGLYVLQDNGILERYDTTTGKRTYKKRIKSSGADFTTSPWVMDGKLFCLSEQGDTYVLNAGIEYELLHSNPVGEFCMSTPAIAGDRLILRTESKVYCISNRQSGS